MNRLSRYLTIFTMMLSLLCSGSVSAQNTKAQETKRARLQQEIELLNKQIKEISSKSSNAQSKLVLTRKKISNRKELIKESEKEISILSDSIRTKQKEIDLLNSRLDTLTDSYARLVNSAYKHRDAREWYMYILASDNIGQGLRRYSYFKNLSGSLNVQATRIQEMKDTLTLEQDRLLGLKQEAEALKASRVKEMDTLKGEEADSQKQINALSKDRKNIEKDITAKKKQVEALNKEIAKIIAEAMKGDTGKGKTGTTKNNTAPIDYKLGGAFQSNKGKLPWPADGPVIEHFGKQYHPVFKNLSLPDSQGISIATDAKAQVKAVYDGKVLSIVVMPGYNQCVLVQHGNYFTFYCKLGAVNVKSGQEIKTGQVIGTVDTISGETQLHFQVWNGNTRENPEKWLRPR